MPNENEIQEKFNLNPDELEINFSQLDVEWGRQDSLLDKYLKASAYCEKMLRKAEEKIKLTRSKLVLEVTSDPEGCLGKGQKANGPQIEAYYRTNEDYIQAKNEWIDAEYICNLVNGQKSRAYGRKTTLEEAAKLSLAGWFSSPLIPRKLADLVQKIEEEKMKSTDGLVRAAVDDKREQRRARRNRPEQSDES